VSIIPVIGFTGDLKLSVIGAILIFILGIVMLVYAFRLFQLRTVKAAKQLMLAMVSYITLLQIIYVADKFLR
jgi:protoheme IX farnesyltransferase